MERSYGCFSRRFVLPEAIDAMAVEASMKSGLLHVQVPKRSRKLLKMNISIAVEE
jgi:heat shock protein Hsp20